MPSGILCNVEMILIILILIFMLPLFAKKCLKWIDRSISRKRLRIVNARLLNSNIDLIKIDKRETYIELVLCEFNGLIKRVEISYHAITIYEVISIDQFCAEKKDVIVFAGKGYAYDPHTTCIYEEIGTNKQRWAERLWRRK